jgi:uncharacterized phiE125 gp8 family phage protein
MTQLVRKIKRTSIVTTEPITLATARLHLRLDAVGSPAAHPDDALVTALIKTARESVESFTELTVAQTTFALALDEFPVNEIPLGTSPVNSITSITYTDTNGATQTLNANQYIFDSYSNPAKIFPVTTWPHTKIVPNAVIVRFAAGFTDGLSPNEYPMPTALKQAMLLYIGELYENREAINVGNIVSEIPYGMIHLMTPYRINMGA